MPATVTRSASPRMTHVFCDTGAVTSIPTAAERARRQLVGAAACCERQLDRWCGDNPGQARAREILSGLACACRRALEVFELDPTLISEPADTGRLQGIAVLADQVFQVTLAVCAATHPRGRFSPAQRWDEVETLYQRTLRVATVLPTVIARRDHATPAGS